MDLGIAGKKAIICAASKGLGKAVQRRWRARGSTSRYAHEQKKRSTKPPKKFAPLGGGSVTAITCDITTDDGRDAVLAACSAPDILVNNAGGPPPGDFRDWERDDWIKPSMPHAHTDIPDQSHVDGMIDRKFGRVVNITSSAVKAPIDILGLSNGARAGLTRIRCWHRTQGQCVTT